MTTLLERNLDQRATPNTLLYAILQGLIDGDFTIGGGGGGGGGDATAANQALQIVLETALNGLVATSANQTAEINVQQAIQAALQGASVSFATVADIVNVAAGTRVQGSAVATPRGVVISARQSNQGQIYIGDVTVTNSSGLKQGLILSPSQQSPVLLVANLNQIYIDVDITADSAGVQIL